MKFRVYRTSVLSPSSDTVELNTIDDLITFIRTCGEDVIFSLREDEFGSECARLEIYDDYRE